jgi:hypothetical protein
VIPPNRSSAFPFNFGDPANEPALAVEVDRMRQDLRSQPPEEIARRVGAVYTPQGPQEGELLLSLWAEPVRLDYPGLVAYLAAGAALPLPVQALLIYYLKTSKGAPPAGEWVSLAGLPGGMMYAQAFQGYSGNRLVRSFGDQIELFRQACQSAGGAPAALADAAFSFTALPRVPLLVTFWQGEDEFPSASKVLFDATATHHLPIDVCAILGSMLVSRIIKAAAGQKR